MGRQIPDVGITPDGGLRTMIRRVSRLKRAKKAYRGSLLRGLVRALSHRSPDRLRLSGGVSIPAFALRSPPAPRSKTQRVFAFVLVALGAFSACRGSGGAVAQRYPELGAAQNAGQDSPTTNADCSSHRLSPMRTSAIARDPAAATAACAGVKLVRTRSSSRSSPA